MMINLTDEERAGLKEVLDPTTAFMEKFKSLAPGSYKHSVNVSNLCESIALELKMDVDFLKGAAMLHDCGKMLNPTYFTENQSGTNPHDDLSPEMSYNMITRHVSDSVLLLTQIPKVPRCIINVVSQHHGSTILASIYSKAKKIHNGSTVEDHYRYKSMSPNSTAAAILMIVDGVEATARAFHNNGDLEKGKDACGVTIDRLIQDRQIDELKIGIVRVIREILTKEVESTYHKRLTYDTEDKTVGETLEEVDSI